LFLRKYETAFFFYYAKVVGNILSNERTRPVARYKEWLVIDEDCEYLNKLYVLEEISFKLKKLVFIYNKCLNAPRPYFHFAESLAFNKSNKVSAGYQHLEKLKRLQHSPNLQAQQDQLDFSEAFDLRNYASVKQRMIELSLQSS